MSTEFEEEQERPSLSDRRAVDTLRLAAAGVLGVLLVLFVVMNTDETKVDFVVTDVDMPLIFVLIGTAVLGAVISHLGLFVYRRRRARER